MTLGHANASASCYIDDGMTILAANLLTILFLGH